LIKKEENNDAEYTEPSIIYSKGGKKIFSEDERIYTDYLRSKDVSELIQELGILKYELRFFEREIESLPKEKGEKAIRRRDRTFRNICAVEKEIAKRMLSAHTPGY
jgi:hypothetical protein